jgi:hypothetical protein
MFQSEKKIPMWGQLPADNSDFPSKGIYITEGTTLETPVRMHRSVARIDVGVGTLVSTAAQVQEHEWTGKNPDGEDIPFQLRSVRVVRPNNRFAVAPHFGTLPYAGSGNPSIPGGTSAFSMEASMHLVSGFVFTASGTQDYFRRQIYVPEFDIKMGTTFRPGDANHLNRMALVVGGFYNNSQTETFYRVDFISGGHLVNVLRNHLYQINIMGVRGAGERTPEEAYKSLAMNMDVEIHEWIPSSEEIFLDGIQWVRLYHTRNESLARHAILYNRINTIDELRFETNILPKEWDLNADGFGLNFGGEEVANDPTFNLADHTLLKTVENNRFRVELIQNNTTQTAEGATIYNGFFRFTSLKAYDTPTPPPHAGDKNSELRVIVNNRIRFPIYISQKGDDPTDWHGGQGGTVCVGGLCDDPGCACKSTL